MKTLPASAKDLLAVLKGFGKVEWSPAQNQWRHLDGAVTVAVKTLIRRGFAQASPGNGIIFLTLTATGRNYRLN